MNPELEIHGHRGCRGHYPENTINGFLKAIELGADVIEMDVVISKDSLVVVSHEPFMNHEISISPDGNTISKEQELDHNLFTMTYGQIEKYDVGSCKHPRFPNQEKIKEYKPTLQELITTIEVKHPGKIKYNIEIKRKPEGDNIYHPDPKTFVDLVASILMKNDMLDRANLQSFDIQTLQYLREAYPSIRVGFSYRKNFFYSEKY